MNGLLPSLPAYALILTLAPATAGAGIYTWIDDHGVTHYGTRVPDKYREQGSRVTLDGNSTFSSVRMPDAGSAGSSGLRPYSRRGSVSTINNSPRINNNRSRTRHNTGTRHTTGSRHAKGSRYTK